MTLVHLVDFKMQRRGIVEDQFHIQVEQVSQAKIEGLLDGVLVGFQHVHGPVEMVQGQCIRSLDADILAQPLLVAIELGTGRTRPIGHHSKESALEGKVNVALGEVLGDDVGDAQALPDGLQDIESAKGPSIEHAPRRVLFHDLVGRAFFQDASGQLAQALGGLGVLGPSAIVDDADFGALFVGIPRTLGQLQMSHDGAISAFLMGFT
jgi:hypothetical protein